jgi:hypothetical protein
MSQARYTRLIIRSWRRLFRRSLWQRTFLAACLPYVLLAAFVDFVHVHAAPYPPFSLAASNGPAVAGSVDGARQTGSACPVCLWLRAGPRLAPQVSIEAAEAAVRSEVAPSTDDAPASPIPLPAAFRGPPRPALG